MNPLFAGGAPPGAPPGASGQGPGPPQQQGQGGQPGQQPQHQHQGQPAPMNPLLGGGPAAPMFDSVDSNPNSARGPGPPGHSPQAHAQMPGHQPGTHQPQQSSHQQHQPQPNVQWNSANTSKDSKESDDLAAITAATEKVGGLFSWGASLAGGVLETAQQGVAAAQEAIAKGDEEVGENSLELKYLLNTIPQNSLELKYLELQRQNREITEQNNTMEERYQLVREERDMLAKRSDELNSWIKDAKAREAAGGSGSSNSASTSATSSEAGAVTPGGAEKSSASPELLEKVKSLETQLSQVQQDRDSALQERDSVREKAKAIITKKQQEAASQMAQLEQQIESQKQEIETQKQQLEKQAQAAAHVSKLEQQIDAQTMQNDALRAQLASQANDAAQANDAELATLKSELAKEREEFEAQKGRMEAERTEMEAKRDEMERGIAERRKEMETEMEQKLEQRMAESKREIELMKQSSLTNNFPIHSLSSKEAALQLLNGTTSQMSDSPSKGTTSQGSASPRRLQQLKISVENIMNHWREEEAKLQEKITRIRCDSEHTFSDSPKLSPSHSGDESSSPITAGPGLAGVHGVTLVGAGSPGNNSQSEILEREAQLRSELTETIRAELFKEISNAEADEMGDEVNPDGEAGIGVDGTTNSSAHKESTKDSTGAESNNPNNPNNPNSSANNSISADLTTRLEAQKLELTREFERDLEEKLKIKFDERFAEEYEKKFEIDFQEKFSVREEELKERIRERLAKAKEMVNNQKEENARQGEENEKLQQELSEAQKKLEEAERNAAVPSAKAVDGAAPPAGSEDAAASSSPEAIEKQVQDRLAHLKKELEEKSHQDLDSRAEEKIAEEKSNLRDKYETEKAKLMKSFEERWEEERTQLDAERESYKNAVLEAKEEASQQAKLAAANATSETAAGISEEMTDLKLAIATLEAKNKELESHCEEMHMKFQKSELTAQQAVAATTQAQSNSAESSSAIELIKADFAQKQEALEEQLLQSQMHLKNQVKSQEEEHIQRESQFGESLNAKIEQIKLVYSKERQEMEKRMVSSNQDLVNRHEREVNQMKNDYEGRLKDVIETSTGQVGGQRELSEQLAEKLQVQQVRCRQLEEELDGARKREVLKSTEVERNEAAQKAKLQEELDSLKQDHETALSNAMRQVRETRLRCEEEKMQYGGGGMDGEKEMLRQEVQDLKQQQSEDQEKYQRLMQGIVQEQEHRVKLEGILDEERANYRLELLAKNDELDHQLRTLQDHSQKLSQTESLQMDKEKLEADKRTLETEKTSLEARNRSLEEKIASGNYNKPGGSPVEDPFAHDNTPVASVVGKTDSSASASSGSINTQSRQSMIGPGGLPLPPMPATDQGTLSDTNSSYNPPQRQGSKEQAQGDLAASIQENERLQKRIHDQKRQIESLQVERNALQKNLTNLQNAKLRNRDLENSLREESGLGGGMREMHYDLQSSFGTGSGGAVFGGSGAGGVAVSRTGMSGFVTTPVNPAFHEFAPHKVHRIILEFDLLCKKGLVLLARVPNLRIFIFSYLVVVLALNLYMISHFLLPGF